MAAPHVPRLRIAAAGVVGALLGVVLMVGLARSAHPDGPQVPEAAVSTSRLATARHLLVAGAPGPQRAALADGRVSVAEYCSAVAHAMACLARQLTAAAREEGVPSTRFSGPAWSVDRYSLTYGYAVAATHLDVRALDRTCQMLHLRRVEALFHLELRADAAYLRGAARRFHACLDAAHLPGRATDRPRARFRAVITSPRVGDRGAVAARRCIGSFPSIGDIDP